MGDEWKESVACSVFTTFAGWTFDNQWELIPGEWVFQIYYEGEKLVEKSFTVYNPDTA